MLSVYQFVKKMSDLFCSLGQIHPAQNMHNDLTFSRSVYLALPLLLRYFP